jgi:hypothetical protein
VPVSVPVPVPDLQIQKLNGLEVGHTHGHENWDVTLKISSQPLAVLLSCRIDNVRLFPEER